MASTAPDGASAVTPHHPLAPPPADLDRTALPLVALAAGTPLYRIHAAALGALWFGPEPTGPHSRFDDPARAFGVCYFGLTREAAFVETFLRRPPVRLVSRAFVDARALTTFVLTRPVHVVRSHGAGLARLGTTAELTSGAQEAARAWSRALWMHPEAPGGIEYRCRHDDDELAVALFDRERSALDEVGRAGIRADRVWFGQLLARYGLALDD